eukprot:CAMPEP_0198214234 /NCGR_PEP_ID=MMETSP1445-20131203/39396_1 /TAXON_ID=36898 /ORGANISM="Pyramimonas sp., Strain CCMP2087" /LENGTH=168 /DNA_ID=CAMNT_0043889323 /DNA_START=193 /DNA_END=699 /DNA_ORIENTATION=+
MRDPHCIISCTAKPGLLMTSSCLTSHAPAALASRTNSSIDRLNAPACPPFAGVERRRFGVAGLADDDVAGLAAAADDDNVAGLGDGGDGALVMLLLRGLRGDDPEEVRDMLDLFFSAENSVALIDSPAIPPPTLPSRLANLCARDPFPRPVPAGLAGLSAVQARWWCL